MEVIQENVAEQVGEALRSAQAARQNVDERLKHLQIASTLLLTKDQGGHLLDNFLDEMVEFGNSTDPRLKCFVATFIENACKKDPEVAKKGLVTLHSLLKPEVFPPSVTKRVITVCASLYPYTLKWAASRKNDIEAEKCWQSFNAVTQRVMKNVDSEHEGIKTVALKFLESVVLAQSHKKEGSEAGRGDIMNISEVPRDHKFISFRKLQHEAAENLKSLLDQTTLSHINSQNLLATISIVCNIARQRPDYLIQVMDALEVLHVNLPPTLGLIQVKSVRKELKMHLLRLLRHPSALPLHPRIITLLTDLGSTQSEINRALPSNLAELKRKARKQADGGGEPRAKKSRSEKRSKNDDDEYGDEGQDDEEMLDNSKQTAVDITAEFIFDRLNHQVVTNLVIIALMTLPDEMPPAFASSYTPIAAAGTEAQRRHLSRMMAQQATQKEIGPGFEKLKEEQIGRLNDRLKARREGAIIPPTPAPHEGGLPSSSRDFKAPRELKPAAFAPATPAPKHKQFSLISVTKELAEDELLELYNLAFQRIMNAERRAVQGGAVIMHNLLLVRLAGRHALQNNVYEDLMIKFIAEEHKLRTDLALLWITELYSQYQGFSHCLNAEQSTGESSRDEKLLRYDRVMCGLLYALHEKGLHKEALFHKILLEAPLVTSNAFQWLKTACLDDTYGAFGMTTMREMILTRNRQRKELLNLLFELSFYEKKLNDKSQANTLRQPCIDTVKELCELSYMSADVRNLLIEQLELCNLTEPPPHFVPNASEDTVVVWDESVFRNALIIYLAVLPIYPDLLIPLARTYASCENREFKRTVLRTVDSAVRAIGIANPEILRLINECPLGAESLVAKVVHLLTERNPVTKELVDSLKRLHYSRKTDVRSLIPVLNGLDLDDIRDMLPKFILHISTQKTISSVFRKILNGRNIQTGEPVLGGVELLEEYHKIEPSTSEEKNNQIRNLEELLDLLSKECVAHAVERLLDQRPLSSLFYYSLVAIYKQFKQLDGFLSNVIQKLIAKELWKITPESRKEFFNSIYKMEKVAFTAILTNFSSDEFDEYMHYLEGNHLKADVVRMLKDHLPSLSSQQQKTISSSIMELIQDKEEQRKREKDDKEREREKERDRERDKNRDERRKAEREKDRSRRERSVFQREKSVRRSDIRRSHD